MQVYGVFVENNIALKTHIFLLSYATQAEEFMLFQ